MRHDGPWTVEPDDDGIRPAGADDACLYCGRHVGEVHKDDCVIPQRTIVVRLEIEYTVKVPEYYTEDNLLFHRNEGTWCNNNGWDELERVMRHREQGDDGFTLDDVGDWCWHSRYAYVREATAEDEARDGVYCPASSAAPEQHSGVHKEWADTIRATAGTGPEPDFNDFRERFDQSG